MQKIKNWLSEENNVYLIRDLLFVFSLLAAFMVFLFGCQRAIPMARADEIETVSETETEATLPKMVLPKLPELSQVEDSSGDFTELKYVFSFNSNKDIYALISSVNRSSPPSYINFMYSNNEYYISFNNLVYGDVYKLESGSWSLKKSNTLSDKVNKIVLFTDEDITLESYNSGFASNNCLLYASSSCRIMMYDHPSNKTKYLDVAADTTFSGTSGITDGSTSFGKFALDTVTTSKSLFEVAKSTVSFLYKNPICILGLILFVICAACGISKNFIRGV